jgi:glyoxylase-like metal-dependent hydrolase (beta-lactamase superfamily II)
VHQHPVAFGDAIECLHADRRMPGGDREGEEALPRLRNGEPELGDLVAGRHPTLHRIRGDAARQHHDVHRNHGSPLSIRTIAAVTDTPVRHFVDVGTAATDHPLAADAIRTIDTGMAAQRELNAVYLIGSDEPCLVETGPGADGPVVLAALDALGIGAPELAHIVVTHIHMDHAGGAGALLRRYPNATLWVHERGVQHVVDPTRLIASTARTYGEARMRAFYGETLPCPPDRVRSVADGDTIAIGDRGLEVVFTPGHATHHVALQESSTGAMFTGEAIGSHLPWADCYRPALPPPEADLEAAIESIARMRERAPTSLLTSHYGVVADPEEGFARGEERIRAWAETVRARLVREPGTTIDALERALVVQARAEYEHDSGLPFDIGRYDAIGSIRMNAEGLARYWRKRWEREASSA